MTAEEIIAKFGLVPHPEGGHYRETYRAPATDDQRSAVSLIYYLLKSGEISAWHQVDAVEIWHYYAGDTLHMQVSPDGVQICEKRLGTDSGAEPQVVIPAGAWQTARQESEWTLVGCTVAPAFEFDGFRLAPPGWQPGKS